MQCDLEASPSGVVKAVTAHELFFGRRVPTPRASATELPPPSPAAGSSDTATPLPPLMRLARSLENFEYWRQATETCHRTVSEEGNDDTPVSRHSLEAMRFSEGDDSPVSAMSRQRSHPVSDHPVQVRTASVPKRASPVPPATRCRTASAQKSRSRAGNRGSCGAERSTGGASALESKSSEAASGTAKQFCLATWSARVLQRSKEQVAGDRASPEDQASLQPFTFRWSEICHQTPRQNPSRQSSPRQNPSQSPDLTASICCACGATYSSEGHDCVHFLVGWLSAHFKDDTDDRMENAVTLMIHLLRMGEMKRAEELLGKAQEHLVCLARTSWRLLQERVQETTSDGKPLPFPTVLATSKAQTRKIGASGLSPSKGLGGGCDDSCPPTPSTASVASSPLANSRSSTSSNATTRSSLTSASGWTVEDWRMPEPKGHDEIEPMGHRDDWELQYMLCCIFDDIFERLDSGSREPSKAARTVHESLHILDGMRMRVLEWIVRRWQNRDLSSSETGLLAVH